MDDFVSSAKAGTHTQKGFLNSAYSTSKMGLSALTRIQQQELNKLGKVVTIRNWEIFTRGPVPRSINSCFNPDPFDFGRVSEHCIAELEIIWKSFLGSTSNQNKGAREPFSKTHPCTYIRRKLQNVAYKNLEKFQIIVKSMTLTQKSGAQQNQQCKMLMNLVLKNAQCLRI